MKTAHIVIKDEVYTHVAGLDPQHIEILVDKMAVMVEGAFFMPAYKMGRWDGKIQFFSRTGKIFTRLLGEIIPYLENWNYQLELRDERPQVAAIQARIGPDWFKKKPEHTLGVELRPYQYEAVNSILEQGSGFVIAATGAGKTWMIAALADAMAEQNLRTIVIVPSSDLVDQTAATLRLGQIDVGTYSGSGKDHAHMCVIATWQALQNNPNIIKTFQCLVVDEAHGASAKVVGELICDHGAHIPYRFGFTGTFPKPKIDQMTLHGSIGEIHYRITAADLIRMGYLAKLEIEPIEIQEDVEEEFPDYGAEKSFISKNEKRLDLLADLIIHKAATYGNTLVLVNSIKQGKELQKRIKDSVFLHGATENEVRAEWYHSFDNTDDLIVIATYGIASTGISIDRIFCEIMIDAGKSFIRCIQSIGRGLRKSGDKDEVHLCDIYSNLKWGRKHFRERKKYYMDAQYPILKTVKARA